MRMDGYWSEQVCSPFDLKIFTGFRPWASPLNTETTLSIPMQMKSKIRAQVHFRWSLIGLWCFICTADAMLAGLFNGNILANTSRILRLYSTALFSLILSDML